MTQTVERPLDDLGVAGDVALGVFSRFCGRLVLENGSRMAVEDFQRVLLADYFRGARETVVIIPKKNGKTTLLAALGIFHLLLVDDAEAVLLAASRDQASILLDQAVGFVRRTPWLADRILIRRGYRELRSLRDNGRLRVLAADVDTADGHIPTLALLDELHRARSPELYGVMRDGLGPRSGQLVAISTAGDAETSPLGLMRVEARQLPVQERDGAHRISRSADGAYVLHEWSLDPGDDRDDLETVKRANPASWQTIDALRERHDSPSTTDAQWARFACGIWMAGSAWWLVADAWRDAASTDRLEPGDEITLGFDGARYGDSTALVACRMADGLVEPLGVWEAGEDEEIATSDVDATLAAVMERYRVVRGYFDPPLWQSEIDAWSREYGGDAITRYATNRPKMLGASERFRTDVAAGTLAHTGDATLTRHVLNTQVREVRGGYVLTKSRPGSPDKIDAAVAAVLAYEARADALDARPPRRSYTTAGF